MRRTPEVDFLGRHPVLVLQLTPRTFRFQCSSIFDRSPSSISCLFSIYSLSFSSSSLRIKLLASSVSPDSGRRLVPPHEPTRVLGEEGRVEVPNLAIPGPNQTLRDTRNVGFIELTLDSGEDTVVFRIQQRSVLARRSLTNLGPRLSSVTRMSTVVDTLPPVLLGTNRS